MSPTEERLLKLALALLYVAVVVAALTSPYWLPFVKGATP